jgi:hypothetical protein
LDKIREEQRKRAEEEANLGPRQRVKVRTLWFNC